jgi:hypothetical protein
VRHITPPIANHHTPPSFEESFTFYVAWRVSYRVSARALVEIQVNLLPQTHFQFLASWKGIVLFLCPEVALTNFEMTTSIIVVVRESEYQSAECMSRHVFWGWHSFIYVPKLCCQRQNFCPYTITEKRMEASSSMIWFSYGWLKSIQKA